MAQLITREYLALLREKHHAKGAPPWGTGGYKFAPEIRWLAKLIDAKTILDYGCGRGTLKKNVLLRRYRIYEYDPGIATKRRMPSKADLVVATDVLEHVEPQCLTAVLDHIYELTQIVCYMVIATRPADNKLPDGRNAHLIIENSDWWLVQLRRQPWAEINVQRVNEDELVVITKC